VTAMLAPSEVAGSLDQLVLDRELVSPETLVRARAVKVEMPIAEAVAAILRGAIDVDTAIRGLLARPLKSEV